MSDVDTDVTRSDMVWLNRLGHIHDLTIEEGTFGPTYKFRTAPGGFMWALGEVQAQAFTFGWQIGASSAQREETAA